MHKIVADYPYHRSRRLRRAHWLREIVSENHLKTNDLIWPVFIMEGEKNIEPI